MRYLLVCAALLLCACSNNFDAGFEPELALNGNYPPTERCEVYEFTAAKEQELLAAGYVRIGTAKVEMKQVDAGMLKSMASSMGKNKGADVILLQQQFLRTRTEVQTLSSTEPGKVTEYQGWDHGRPYKTTAYSPPTTTTAYIPREVKDYNYTAVCFRKKSTIPAAPAPDAPAAPAASEKK